MTTKFSFLAAVANNSKLNESIFEVDDPNATAEEFANSEEATSFMEKIRSMLADPRLESWARVTDNNFSVETEDALHEAKDAFETFFNGMLDAE